MMVSSTYNAWSWDQLSLIFQTYIYRLIDIRSIFIRIVQVDIHRHILISVKEIASSQIILLGRPLLRISFLRWVIRTALIIALTISLLS